MQSGGWPTLGRLLPQARDVTLPEPQMQPEKCAAPAHDPQPKPPPTIRLAHKIETIGTNGTFATLFFKCSGMNMKQTFFRFFRLRNHADCDFFGK